MSNKNCTGCGLCAFLCPAKCIKMRENIEGFRYPIIDKNKCINCGLCKKKCPLKMQLFTNKNARTFVFQTKDKKELLNCASGGVFYSIATSIINKGGSVVGVRTNKDLSIDFSLISQKEGIHDLLNSKYFQCELKDTLYLKIKEVIKKNVVLFSGTPCQVAAVVKYFEKDNNRSNLITLEILCQGVPSYKAVKYFYNYYEKKEKSKLVEHKFRSKLKYVGRNYFSEYKFKNETTKSFVGEDDILTLSFQRNLFLRNSCYHCYFANSRRVADFTCGDIWEINKNTIIDIKKGASVVRCNNDRAVSLLYELDNCCFYEIDEIDALKDNIPFNRSVKKPFFRYFSYKLLNTKIPIKIIVILGAWKYYLKKIVRGYKR